MKKFDPMQLSYFTGTEKYYRISRRHLLTDGTKYLAEEAECFWMMDAIASHLSEIGIEANHESNSQSIDVEKITLTDIVKQKSAEIRLRTNVPKGQTISIETAINAVN
jgi:hypothetical protein